MNLRLDYVSPLPPVRSGIADYSLDLLPELARRCDLRLVRLPEQDVAPEILERWTVVEADRLGEDGRLPLYQMGNNRHHQAVDELARRVPGALTLHDVVLHHFLIDQTLNRGDFASYRERLAREHGWIGRAAAQPLQWPGGYGNAVQFSLPAHRSLLRSQRGVVVHSPWSAEWLRDEIDGLRLAVVPMGIPLPELPDPSAAAEFRRRHGLPADAPLIGSFGFQTPIKRTEVAIAALATPPLAGAHLMIAGEVAPILKLEDVARRAGVLDRVHVLGFLPYDEFETAITAADVCLNLRYPTAGETSAALLRVLALGGCAVVSDYGTSADLPDDVVVKVPLGDGEVAGLSERVAALLDDRPRLQRLGERAREHIRRRHAVPLAAEELVAACTAWLDAEPLGSVSLAGAPVEDLPEEEDTPPTSLIWPAMGAELEVRGAETPWPQGERRELELRLSNVGEALWLAGERIGGVALNIQLLRAGDVEERGWLGLPRDLPPGGEHVFRLPLRRPLGEDVALRIVPHVLVEAAFDENPGEPWTVTI